MAARGTVRSLSQFEGKGAAAQNAAKNACKRGHLFTERNTRWIRAREGSLIALWRVCKTCESERQKRRSIARHTARKKSA